MANSKKSKGNTKSKSRGASAGSAQQKAKSNVKLSAKSQGDRSQANVTKPKASKKSASQKGTSSKLDKVHRQDIIRLILDDHKPLKKLIKVLKNADLDINDRQEAFDEFAPLFTNHAKPEEQSLYIYMKDDDELREEGFEAEVEHSLADQLVEEIKRTENDDLWSARVKVLAELVENHIEEEENEILPDFRKHSAEEDRIQLGQAFMRLKSEYESMGGRDTVAEDAMEIHPNH